MLRCLLALALCVEFLAVVRGGDATETANVVAEPLIAPKPLILLDQIEGSLPDDFIVATVDGVAVTLEEVIEHGGFTHDVNRVKSSYAPAEYRSLQEILLKRNLRATITTRLCVRAFERQLSEDELRLVEPQIDAAWSLEVQSLQRKFEASTLDELEEYLERERSQSLSSLKKQFSERAQKSHYVSSLISGRQLEREQKEKIVNVAIERLFVSAQIQTVVDISEEPRE